MAPGNPPKVKKKLGNRGDFHGSREEFLMSKMSAYLAASKAKEVPAFWPGLFAEYWKKFHWTLPLDTEPAPTDVYPDDTALTAAQTDKKTEVQTTIKAYNHKRTAMAATSNVYTPFLAQLCRPDRKAPKRAADYQFYMHHPPDNTATPR
ncbi:hypothetical protein K438DRAFT_2002558 [Mycena galopus ATCC 62051]|nr:hypothetical protein K438DRAFT_2002558 [Mycena galopus ATCC 62051]